MMPFTFAILASVLGYTWIAKPLLPDVYVAVPAAIVIVLGLWHDLQSGEWGIDPRAFWGAVRATAIFTVVALVVLLGAGAALGTLHLRMDTAGHVALLIVWGAAQQWLLQTVILREAQRATSRRAGQLLAPVLFAALHLPNPFLAAATLAGALGWCAIYDRYPNILPLAFSHAMLTMAILVGFDAATTGGLQIGLAYLTR
jgi:membrane protease YdiL (CAAX protease family)